MWNNIALYYHGSQVQCLILFRQSGANKVREDEYVSRVEQPMPHNTPEVIVIYVKAALIVGHTVLHVAPTHSHGVCQ